MIHQAPAGARDWLPLEVAQKCWISEHLHQVFQQWGYQQIITSTLEWVETLVAGGAIERSTVLQVQDGSDGVLGLRPELTASIARAAVTRMAGKTLPLRLFYNANVFRCAPDDRGRQMEFYQAGVELLGIGGVLADAEILLLLANCLRQVGLEQWHLVLGEAGLTRSLLAPFPEPLQTKVRRCIAYLDRVSLAKLPLSPELQKRALMLFDLRGKPSDVLQQVATLDLDESGQAIVRNLKSLVELLGQSTAQSLSIVLDLSLIETIDYYTGIVFEIVTQTETEARVLGKGGRYDGLLGLYHPQGESAPGIGFALNLEELHASLLSSPQLPQATPASDWLVIPKTPSARAAAFTYAQQLRRSENLVRVEMELGDRSAQEIRNLAHKRRIPRLAWIQADGTAEIETL